MGGAMPRIADPERALTLIYVPRDLRSALEALWRLDDRLAPLGVGRGGNPAVDQIKLAWWRDALKALDHGPPPGEPLLQNIAQHLLPRGVSGAELAVIVDGWEALGAAELDDRACFEAHARDRGGRLFTLAARVLAGEAPPEVQIAGEMWAAWDISGAGQFPPQAAIAGSIAAERDRVLGTYRWPPALRPLGMLAVLARREMHAPHLFHRAGSPGRLLRMLLHWMTGR
jgi:phytoene synthase